MTQKEIEQMMQMSIRDLYELCKSPELLELILRLAIDNGVRKGQCDVLRNYNQAFKGYTLETIRN